MMTISTEQWQDIERELGSSIASVKFTLGENEISCTRVRVKENRTALAVYVNGEIAWKHAMQSDEQPELIRNVWRKRTIAAYSPAKKQKLIKSFGKRKVKEYFPNLDKVTTYYDPMFNTAKSLVRQFKKLDGLAVNEIGFKEVN